jgi:hypothetical protein
MIYIPYPYWIYNSLQSKHIEVLEFSEVYTWNPLEFWKLLAESSETCTGDVVILQRWL